MSLKKQVIEDTVKEHYNTQVKDNHVDAMSSIFAIDDPIVRTETAELFLALSIKLLKPLLSTEGRIYLEKEVM